MLETDATQPITIKKGSFNSFTVVNKNDPLYEALGHRLHPTHVFRNKAELMAYLEGVL